ncbi:transcriptional attenuator, LytR family [Amycolatopsis marina]|uniref:Transcriptional attenuator, LytR family n=2 Tax=Amycolatopsis marina TaxID=490629 RepID=A0A1I0YKE0_9PSEU|nr:transcriptional attenuator, LytR family [Amycolatopsis marina]
MVSLLVMSLTGYGWAAMQGLVSGLTMTDVIAEDGGGDKPADGARDILLVGMDSRTDAQGNPLSEDLLAQLRAGVADGELNTDSLIFVHIPNDGSKAVAISLPRDSYVDIPGYGKHKINSAYARAKMEERSRLEAEGVTDPKELEVQSNQAGAKTLVATVEQLTGSTIDNYASINLLGFFEITKAIGGVEVCLNEATKDRYSGADFKAGRQTISGFDALAFVRQRHGLLRGDLDRVVRQQVFMAGLAKKVLSAGTLADPGKLNELVGAIKKSVVLNQGWDILGFAQQMKGLTGGQIEFRTIPTVNIEYETPNDGTAIQVDPDQVQDFVQGLAGPPQQPGEGASKEQEDLPAKSTITVNVQNGTSQTGLAASVSQSLTEQGFAEGETGNAAPQDISVVRVPPGTTGVGEQVAGALEGDVAVEEDSSVPAGHATVVLGTDYSGSSTGQSTGSGNTGGASGAGKPAAAQADGTGGATPEDEEPPITAGGVPCVN